MDEYKNDDGSYNLRDLYKDNSKKQDKKLIKFFEDMQEDLPVMQEGLAISLVSAFIWGEGN